MEDRRGRHDRRRPRRVRAGARARARPVERRRGRDRAPARSAPAAAPDRPRESARRLSRQERSRNPRDPRRRVGEHRPPRSRIPPSRPALRLRPLFRRDRAHRGRRHRALHRARRGRQAGPDLLGPSRQLGAAADLRRPLWARRDRGLPPAERTGGRPCAARDQEPDHGRARGGAAGRRLRDARRARARRPSRHADRPAFHPRRHGRLPRPAGIHQSDHGQVRARLRLSGPRRARDPARRPAVSGCSSRRRSTCRAMPKASSTCRAPCRR